MTATRDSQHPATALFLALLLANAFGLRQPGKVIETGTVLFTSRDAMTCCLPTEKYAVLVFRQLLTNIISVPLQNPRGDAYIVSFVAFVHASARKAVNCSPPPVARAFVYALFDTVGGYLNTYLLPVSMEGFYAGNVRFSEMRKLHAMFQDIKDYLHTNGRGWRGPLKKYGVSHKVRPLNMTRVLCNEDNLEVCENFLVNTGPDLCEGGSVIPIPFLDDEKQPRSVALPLRFGSLHSIETHESAYLVLGHYARSMMCLKSKNVTKSSIMDYNKKFRSWLIESVLPHLQDEKWYPAFGGILRVLRATGENCFGFDGKSPKRPRRSLRRRFSEKMKSEKLKDIRSKKSTDSVHETYRLRRRDTSQSKQEQTRRYQDEQHIFDKTDINNYNSNRADEYNRVKMNQCISVKKQNSLTNNTKDITSNERGNLLKNYDDKTRLREYIRPVYRNIGSDRKENRKKKRHSSVSHIIEIQSHINNVNRIYENMKDDQNALSFAAMGMDDLSGDDNLVAIDEEALRTFKHAYNRNDTIVTSVSRSELEQKQHGNTERLASFNIRAPRDPRGYRGRDSFSAREYRTRVSQVTTATEAIEGSIIIGNETTNFTLMRKQEILDKNHKETNPHHLSDGHIQKSLFKENSTKSPYRNDLERENTDSMPKKNKVKCGEILIEPDSEETNVTSNKKSHKKEFENEYKNNSDKKHISKDFNKYVYDTTVKDDSNENLNVEFASLPIEEDDEYITSSVQPYLTTCFTTCMPVYYDDQAPRHKTTNEKPFRTFASCTTHGKRVRNATAKRGKSRCYGEKLFEPDSTTDVKFNERENQDKKCVTTSHKGVKISKGIIYHQADKVTTKRSRLNNKKTERIHDMYVDECVQTTKCKSKKEHQSSGRQKEEKPCKEEKLSLISEHVTTPTTYYPRLSEFTWPTQRVRPLPPPSGQCSTTPPQPPQNQTMLSNQPQVISHSCATTPASCPLFLGLFGRTSTGPWINITDKCVVRACDGRHAPAPLVPHLLGDILQSPACNLDFYMYHIVITVILWLLLLCASLGQEDMHCRWRVEARPRPCARRSTESDKHTIRSQGSPSARHHESPTYLSMDGDFSWHGGNVDPHLLTLAPSYVDKRYRFAPWSEIGTKEERTPLYSSSPKSTSLPTSTCSVQQTVSGSNEAKVEATNCLQPYVRPPLKFLLHAGNKFKYSSESEPPVSEAEDEHTIDEP